MSPEAVTIGIFVVGGFAVVIWWVMRQAHSKVEDERRERIADSHKIRNEIQVVTSNLQDHELLVERQFVSNRALDAAMKPLQDSMNRVERALERLFDELKTKQDKPGHGD